MEHAAAWWIGFNLLVFAMLALDLGVFQRKAHEVKFWEAVWLSVFWFALALVFNVLIWIGWVGDYPPDQRSRVALEFLTGYLIERSLSFDNLFVFAVIFQYFAVPAQFQHRVLFLGILGALIFRAIFIFGGLFLIQQFHWMLYVFGVFLIWTGYKLAFTENKEIQPEKNPIIRFCRRFLPLSDRYDGGRLFTRQRPAQSTPAPLAAGDCDAEPPVATRGAARSGLVDRLVGTPLLLVLIFIETTDVVFALDSIPAIIAITQDSFIVYTSNVFAILGLRAIYFVLASMMKLFTYLNIGLALLMAFIGGKMLVEAAELYHMPSWLSLTIVCLILGASIGVSMLFPPKPAKDDAPPA